MRTSSGRFSPDQKLGCGYQRQCHASQCRGHVCSLKQRFLLEVRIALCGLDLGVPQEVLHLVNRLAARLSEEAKTCLWVMEGLDRQEEHVRATGGDEELLDLIDYLREDNEQWIDPDFAEKAAQAPTTLPS